MAKKQSNKSASLKTSDASERVPFPKATQVFETNDGYENFATRIGLQQNNQQSAGGYGNTNYITKNRQQLENAYRSSWVVGCFIDYKAEDMTRAGITLTTNDAPEKIKDFKTEMTRLQIAQGFQDTIKWGNLYGGAIAVMQISGADLSTPLDLDKVGKDQFKGLAVYDRWQLQPDLTRIITEGPDMGLPEYYTIVTTNTMMPAATPVGGAVPGMRVHHSRCIRFVGIKLPHNQAIAENLWGESQLERMYDRLMSFDNATLSSAALIDRANLRTISVKGLRQILALGGKSQEALVAMFDSIRLLQNNLGLTIIDSDDTMSTTSYTFAGLSDMMLQFGQQLSGATGIPLVRFFGQSPAGLSSTGESDLRMYYDNINAQQEAKLRNPFEVLVRVMWRSKFDEAAPADLTFIFTPLWQMSAKDKSDIAKSDAETITGVYTAGLISQKTALEELRTDSGATGLFANISDEDIAAAEVEVAPEPDLNSEENSSPSNEDEVTASKLRLVANDSDFKESEHPRKDDGKFGVGAGSAKAKKSSTGGKSKPTAPSETEARAIRNYTGALSSTFIEADRGKEIDPENKARNDELNRYLSKASKYKGDIHRGIVVEKSEIEGILSKYAQGAVVENDAKQSWTKDPKAVADRLISVSKEKKNPVKVFFEYPDSDQSVDISEHSRFPEEQEVVLPKNNKLVVSKVEKSDDGYKIILKHKSTTDSKYAAHEGIKAWLSRN